MSKEGNFLIYCVEKYKSEKNLTGKQVSAIFTKYRVWEYKMCIRDRSGYSDISKSALYFSRTLSNPT